MLGASKSLHESDTFTKYLENQGGEIGFPLGTYDKTQKTMKTFGISLPNFDAILRGKFLAYFQYFRFWHAFAKRAADKSLHESDFFEGRC